MIGDGSLGSDLSLQLVNLLKNGLNQQPQNPKLSDNLQINLKLNSQNNALWTRMIRVAIGGKSKSLLSHMTTDPPDQTSEDYEQWEQEDLIVFSWLIQNIEPALVGNLTEYPTTKMLWDALVVTYSSGRDKLQTFNLHVKANDIKQNNSSLEDFWISLQEGTKNSGPEKGKASIAGSTKENVDTTYQKNLTGFGGMENIAQNLSMKRKLSWIFDCGATYTMTYDLSDFATSTKPTKSYIDTANGEKMIVKTRGTIEISPTLKLSNCLYVHALSHKLLSISHVTKELNCSVLMQPTFCILHDIRTGAIIGRGTEIKGLYYVDEVAQNGAVMLSHGTTEREAWLWHRRLGHPSNEYYYASQHSQGESECLDTLNWLRYVACGDGRSHSTADESHLSTQLEDHVNVIQTTPNLIPEVSNPSPISNPIKTNASWQDGNVQEQEIFFNQDDTLSELNEHVQEQEESSTQEETSERYVLPPKANRGVPPKRYSPEKVSRGSRYPMANIAKGNISKEAKAFVASVYSDEIPANTKQALKSRKWKKAMEEEMEALTKINTWENVSCHLERELSGVKTGMIDCKPANTPMIVNQELYMEEKAKLADKGRYQRMVGKLIYLSHTPRYSICCGSSESVYASTPEKPYESSYENLKISQGNNGAWSLVQTKWASNSALMRNSTSSIPLEYLGISPSSSGFVTSSKVKAIGVDWSAGFLQSTPITLTLDDVTNSLEEGEILRYSKGIEEVEFRIKAESFKQDLASVLVGRVRFLKMTLHPHINYPIPQYMIQFVKDDLICNYLTYFLNAAGLLSGNDGPRPIVETHGRFGDDPFPLNFSYVAIPGLMAGYSGGIPFVLGVLTQLPLVPFVEDHLKLLGSKIAKYIDTLWNKNKE
nr:putative Gag-polypeptide of LTR copia-type [Tanacetum cinerariifolium]